MGLKKVKLQMMNSCPLAATVHVQTLFFKRVRERKVPRKMATHAENICFLDKHEIRESYFKGILLFNFEIFLSSNLLLRR